MITRHIMTFECSTKASRGDLNANDDCNNEYKSDAMQSLFDEDRSICGSNDSFCFHFSWSYSITLFTKKKVHLDYSSKESANITWRRASLISLITDILCLALLRDSEMPISKSMDHSSYDVYPNHVPCEVYHDFYHALILEPDFDIVPRFGWPWGLT